MYIIDIYVDLKPQSKLSTAFRQILARSFLFSPSRGHSDVSGRRGDTGMGPLSHKREMQKTQLASCFFSIAAYCFHLVSQSKKT